MASCSLPLTANPRSSGPAPVRRRAGDLRPRQPKHCGVLTIANIRRLCTGAMEINNSGRHQSGINKLRSDARSC